MIKLKLLLESPETTDSDQWDSWQEYLEYFEYDIEKCELSKLIKKFGLKGKGYFNNRIVKIFDKEPVFLEYNPKNETFDVIKDINDWISNSDGSDFIDPDTIYNRWTECSLKDMKGNPGKVYHYTTEEKWALIQQSGKMVGSYGSGINNHGAYGIFTSVDPQEYSLGSYGNICLELDLQKFKQESNLPELDLDFEPQVVEYLAREYLNSALEMNDDRDEIENDGGISPYTVIVNHIIPTRYVRQLS